MVRICGTPSLRPGLICALLIRQVVYACVWTQVSTFLPQPTADSCPEAPSYQGPSCGASTLRWLSISFLCSVGGRGWSLYITGNSAQGTCLWFLFTYHIIDVSVNLQVSIAYLALFLNVISFCLLSFNFQIILMYRKVARTAGTLPSIPRTLWSPLSMLPHTYITSLTLSCCTVSTWAAHGPL